MTFRNCLAVALAAGLLTGCAAGYKIDALQKATPTGSPFAQALTEEYRALATFEGYQMFDWFDAEHFARKGLRAAEGEAVEPEALEGRRLPSDRLSELGEARTRLLSLLDASARDKVPALAAHTQGRFDCWVEQQEENFQWDHISSCRAQFYAALAAIDEAMRPPPAPAPEPPAAVTPETFVVYFTFDSAVVDDEGRKTVADAISYAQRTGLIEFSVTGHADRSGPEDYNLRLSLRRADAVRQMLVEKGILDRNVSVAGRGESEPAVPTADGVREPKNRRVEIIVQ